MEWWQIVLLSIAAAMLLLFIAVFILWRKAAARTKRLAARLQALPWQGRFNLAGAVATDERLAPMPRLILPALLVYLSLPIDLLPDFIPIIGQIDDALALAVGIGLMRGSLAWQVLESHLVALEAQRSVVIDSRTTA